MEPITQVTDYLDIKFNLLKHVHEPFRKPNDQPICLNVKSDHPNHIIKHIPIIMEQRISNLLSTEDIFATHKIPYEEYFLFEQLYNCLTNVYNNNVQQQCSVRTVNVSPIESAGNPCVAKCSL